MTMDPQVPLEHLAREAYVEGDIEIGEFEDLIAAALQGRAIDLSLAMQARTYTHLQSLVRFSHVAILKDAWNVDNGSPATNG